MNGLEKLNKLIDGSFLTKEFEDELREIAAEIADDFKELPRSAWIGLAEFMNELLDGKYIDLDEPGIFKRWDGTMKFQDWLDYWYIPKPVDANGEPIDFDKLYDHGCGAIQKIRIHKVIGEYSYVIVSHDGTSYYHPQSLRAEVDPWEELRCEIEYALMCGYSPEEANVSEWIEKAKKLGEER